MKNEIRTVRYPNGEIQRVQAVFLDDWDTLEFCFPEHTTDAVAGIAYVYNSFLLPAAPWLFGKMGIFSLPTGLEAELPMHTETFGDLSSGETAARILLKQGVRLGSKGVRFRGDAAEALYRELETAQTMKRADGLLPLTEFIPVRRNCALLSEAGAWARLIVNSSFFIMDPIDCSSIYDSVGTPVGLMAKDGKILNPPLFGREALVVTKNGKVRIAEPVLEELEIWIGGKRRAPGPDSALYSRPAVRRTPLCRGCEVVVIGNRVAAVHRGGGTQVPCGGFVLRLRDDGEEICPGMAVEYRGMEDVLFAVQAGNSAVVNGIVTDRFISRFYNIRRLERVPFPPSLYPVDYHGARAARIVLGATRDGGPVLVWAEGKGKLNYRAGNDSCGASLSEMAKICSELGLVNAVNLDGGGSAQILLNGVRSLRLADRDPNDSDAERAVPAALIVR